MNKRGKCSTDQNRFLEQDVSILRTCWYMQRQESDGVREKTRCRGPEDQTYLKGLVDGQAPDGQSRLEEADDDELWSTKTEMK